MFLYGGHKICDFSIKVGKFNSRYPYSGSGFQSLQSFGSGWFSMRIKLPQRDSTAVITTFYLISEIESIRDEIDFEFLGGNLKEPHVLHTNIYIDGQGGREQQFHFWFDPLHTSS
ncbi:hypothetical protein TSUD_389930 [Trifolium subterraneum]|uniref:GH16 domain-containing protein n=1 Tax=Trifolium subterraneum TaxID=3900 RepID=A0A2Z6NFC9_TRISU|nr:hypothetical protein TSUD_389930 [Trifolium subterraneum]